MIASTVAENSFSYSYSFDPLSSVFALIVTALIIIGMWVTFIKAGRPGWAAIIPFYNIYTLCKVAGKPGWWWIWYLIPIVNIIIGIIVAVNVARNFGKGGAYGFFLLYWLQFIGYPLIAFGSAVYQGPRAETPRADAVRI
ncbi:DUF5684 domain-containing protein [Herbiconiux sp. UC225_62]|uniref:DUF5684 domain-containing protein n=1 Tax=Herbiconiux sp. UC225_62 TaxID=3350168 RepID=UPI0036D2AF37